MEGLLCKEKTSIGFCITVDNESEDSLSSKEFFVPYDWAVQWIQKNQNITIEQFSNEYTSDESGDMYSDAILEGVLISEKV